MEKKLYNLKTNMFFSGKKIFTHLHGVGDDESYHSHSFIEFFYVVSGSCAHEYNEKGETLKAGDAYLLLLSDRHGFDQSLNKNLWHRDVLMTTDFFKSVCDELSPALYGQLCEKKFPLKIHLADGQIELLENMIFRMQHLSGEFDMYAVMLVHQILSLLINAKPFNFSHIPSWLNHLTSILAAPNNFKTALGSIMSVFKLDKSYMCRVFKNTHGVTMTDYFNRKKIDYAYMLIDTTDNSLQEISEEVGFKSMTHFYRCFNKYCGCTPNSLRAANKREKEA